MDAVATAKWRASEMAEFWELEAQQIAFMVKNRDVTAVAVTQSVLDRLADVNPNLNAVVQEMPDAALAAARALDERISAGEPAGILAGVPITIKVNIDQAGYANTNGLKLQKDHLTDQDNPVVTNLKNADAICVGRTNTPAFSMRWFTRNTVHGHTRNPHNAILTPGGSSGGAASAVAAGIGPISHGSDIAGSIRYPAYACGIHGLRPTVGRVAAYNPCAPDRHLGAQMTAVSGPHARSIADIRLALEAMAARDVRDPWWAPVPLDLGPYEKRAALCINPDGLKTSPVVEAALRDAAKRLEDAGWRVDEVDCPPLREPAQLQILNWMSESRHTGIDVFEREDDPDASFVFAQFQKHYPATDLGGYLDIMQARLGFIREWMAFCESYPMVLTPVSGETPFIDNIDVASEADFLRVIEAQMPQIGLPLLGLPGLAVTTSVTDNVPVGVQLVAGRFREDVLLDAGADIADRGAALPPVTPNF